MGLEAGGWAKNFNSPKARETINRATSNPELRERFASSIQKLNTGALETLAEILRTKESRIHGVQPGWEEDIKKSPHWQDLMRSGAMGALAGALLGGPPGAGIGAATAVGLEYTGREIKAQQGAEIQGMLAMTSDILGMVNHELESRKS